MTANEAYTMIMNEFPQTKALSCYEFKELFVFTIVRKTFDETKSEEDIVLDCAWSVNKKTKEIEPFNPLDMSPTEYKNGHEVKRFDK